VDTILGSYRFYIISATQYTCEIASQRERAMSLMIIKRIIPKIFKGTVSDDITSAKEFLAEIEKRFAKSVKAKTSTLLQNLSSMKYQGK